MSLFSICTNQIWFENRISLYSSVVIIYTFSNHWPRRVQCFSRDQKKNKRKRWIERKKNPFFFNLLLIRFFSVFFVCINAWCWALINSIKSVCVVICYNKNHNIRAKVCTHLGKWTRICSPPPYTIDLLMNHSMILCVCVVFGRWNYPVLKINLTRIRKQVATLEEIKCKRLCFLVWD